MSRHSFFQFPMHTQTHTRVDHVDQNHTLELIAVIVQLGPYTCFPFIFLARMWSLPNLYFNNSVFTYFCHPFRSSRDAAAADGDDDVS